MNDELDLLIERYLAGSAGEADVQRLEELLRIDPDALDSFVLALEEDVALRKCLSVDSEGRPVAAAESRDVRASGRRRTLRRRAGSGSNPWAPLLAAAAIFLVLLWWGVSAPDPEPRMQVRRPERTREEQDRARQRLVEIDLERKALVEPPPAPGKGADTDRETAQRQRLEELDAERRRIEKELQEAAVPAFKPPSRTPEPPPPPSPAPAPSETTRVDAMGVVIDRVDGKVSLLASGEKTAAAAGVRVGPNQSLETEGGRSLATLVFADGTRLDLGGDTSIRDLAESSGPRGKRLTLARGSLTARVARQAGGPMVVATPQGEARVLGTTFRLVVDGGSTKLEVSEGKVQLRRRDGKSVDVSAGHLAVAAPGVDLAARPLPIEEIVLLPEQARVSGAEWKLVKDPAAVSGSALEALDTAYKLKKSGNSLTYDSVRNRTAYVFFTFAADAGRDYHVWIRGETLATSDRKLHDEIAIEPLNGTLSQKCRQLGWTGDNAYCYTGWCLYPAYYWLGGYGEDGTSDVVPLSIRFSRPGLQTLKLYAIETPMRIDAIWLSTTQGNRPAADQRPPLRESK